MEVKWILQTNIFRERCIERMIETFERQNILYEPIEIIPFSDELPKIKPHNGPIVAYGTTTLLRSIDREKCWYPGMWYDNTTFKPSVWGIRFKNDWLNNKSKFFFLSEFENIKDEFLKHGQLFIRPNSDLKLFNGDVFDFYEFEKWYENLEIRIESCAYKNLDKNAEISTAPVHNILSEWRYVICNKKVIAGSKYRYRGRLYQSSKPEDMDEGANLLTKNIADNRWQLSRVYVVDICKTKNDYKIIEFNTFNASGLYDCDIMSVVHDVTKQAERQWKNKNNQGRTKQWGIKDAISF